MSLFRALDPDAVEAATLRRLERLVSLQSPSDDEALLRAVASDFAAQLTSLGAAVETRDVPGVGEHVIGRFQGADPSAAPVLVLGHLDTVHPVGVFDPVFRREGGRAYGSGVFDMKGGWACMLEALARLHDAAARPARPVLVVATCDEETGSATSRAMIEALASDAEAALVMEPPLPDGSAKTRRKGVAWYGLTVHGRASHAGLTPDEGVNAVVELAHQVQAIAALADPTAGTTVGVTQATGGTATNVIPARAWVGVDVRFATMAEADRVDAGMRALAPVLDGARLELEGGLNRPPMERTEGAVRLYEAARSLASEAGWTLGEGESGGASDGSLTAGIGTPTLDGIGPVGGGAHAADEHVMVADLPRRVALYGRLLETL